MENDNEIIENSDIADNSIDYIEAINELENNTVPKEVYERLREDNKKLLDTVARNNELKTPEIIEPVDIGKLVNETFDTKKDISNLNYVSNVLKIRKEFLDKNGIDLFVSPNSTENSDYEKADQVAEILQGCVDSADGNPAVFRNELERKMVDVIMPKKR